MKVKISAHGASSSIPPIKAVRAVTGLGLQNAKDVIDNLPQTIEVLRDFSVTDVQREFDEYGITDWEVVGMPDVQDRLSFLIEALNNYAPSLRVDELLDVLKATRKALA